MPNVPGWEPPERPRRPRQPTTPTGRMMVAHFINPDKVLAVEAEAVSLHHTQGGCTWCAVIAKTAREQERERLRQAVLELAAATEVGPVDGKELLDLFGDDE